VHGLRPSLPGELRLARDRVRAATMAAETVLHDLGVIPITSSDAQGMGRAGETVRRTFALAAKNRFDRGGDEARHDNVRVLRYLAKLTINPAIAHGLAGEIGSVEVGKLADVVLWEPAFFAAKPALVLKAGFPAWGVTGDPNASVDRAEPLVLGPQFGGHGLAPADLSVAFVSQAALEQGGDRLRTSRRRVGVRRCRGIGLSDMVRNTTTGSTQVDPGASQVTFDGQVLTARPAANVSLNRLYFL
jgi:urease subunit alpha